jgi:hypothetical protein
MEAPSTLAEGHIDIFLVDSLFYLTAFRELQSLESINT